MKEKIKPIGIEEKQESVADDGNRERASGRTFEGVSEQPEKFSILEKGKDYEITRTNPSVKTNEEIGKYFVFVNPSKGTKNLMVSPPHWRTVSSPDFSGMVNFQLPNGDMASEPFFEANTKGVGYLKPTARGSSLDEECDQWMVKDEFGAEPFGYRMLGLANLEDFESSDGEDSTIDKSMRLLQAGLRVEAFWGVAKLNNVVYKGKPMSIQELRDKKIITSRKTFQPALVIRLFKTNSRIEEAYRDEKRRNALFDKAFEIYNKEERIKHPDNSVKLHKGNIGEERKFFAIFFERMGTNLAVLFNEGMHSLYLHSSNVTLAAEIADINTMTNYKDEKQKHFVKKYRGVRFGHLKDTRDIAYGLRFLAKAGRKAGLHIGSHEARYNAFMKGFREKIDNEQLRQQDTDPQKAEAWVSQIAGAVIVRRKRLAPLVHYGIEDWPINGPEESQ